jgi:hypothetical protein
VSKNRGQVPVINVPRTNNGSERRDLEVIASPLHGYINIDNDAAIAVGDGGSHANQTIKAQATRRLATSLQKSRTRFYFRPKRWAPSIRIVSPLT